jgi:hypothetical protein
MRKTLEIDPDCLKYLKIQYLYLYVSGGGGGGSAARLTPLIGNGNIGVCG